MGVKAFLSVLAFVVGIIIAATLINQFIFQSYYVDGTSMTPTLHNNDRLIIDKVERTAALVQGKHYIPQRGQIVVLDSSLVDQSGHNEQLIKRVIGLPGDSIAIDNGIVTITNKEHPNGFNANDSLGLHLEPTFVDSPPFTATIGDNQIFVMGDNRAPGGSFDSRSFGAVDSSKIQGRLLARIFPLNQTKLF
jgi:signal peptidase I